MPLRSPADIDRIAALPDPAVRNLLITQAYHELSQAFSLRSGVCANWCTFATWASKQAGQSIRREDLDRTLERLLADLPALVPGVEAAVHAALRLGARQSPTLVQRLIWEALHPAAAMERAADAVARGNRKVFAEIGREFARFAEMCQSDPVYQAERLETFCAGLRPGPPPDGQDYLRQAFSDYYRAFFEPDPQQKAQLLLLANLRIGWHEQNRLQPEIAEALEASVVDPKVFIKRLITSLFPSMGWLVYAGVLLMRLLGRPTRLDRALEQFLTLARRQIRLFLSRQMMTLAMPDGVPLRLGSDLQADFPASLRVLNNVDLLALLRTIDPTPDSVRDTGAVDWAALPERMHYIADLFRCFHEQEDLLGPPFSTEQVEAMQAGKIPPGKL